MTALAERAALVSLLRSLPRGARWSDVADALLEHGSAATAWKAEAARRDSDRVSDIDALFDVDPNSRADSHALEGIYDEALQDVAAWETAGLRMITILDGGYPDRLREIHQAPPFLFASGVLLADDPAIAVVGSRKASPGGLKVATSIATRLAGEGITVLFRSGRGH